MVLVFAESPNGHLKKAAFEAVTYGKKAADLLGTSCVALCLGDVENAGVLGSFGASNVYHVANSTLNSFDSQSYSAAIAAAVEKSLLIMESTVRRPRPGMAKKVSRRRDPMIR